MTNLIHYGKEFEATVRIFSETEGGRQTPVFNGIRWDFAYAEDRPSKLYMIWPDFLTADGRSFSNEEPLPVGVELLARLSTRQDEMWDVVHRSRIAPGVRFYLHEGGRRVAEGVVLRLLHPTRGLE